MARDKSFELEQARWERLKDELETWVPRVAEASTAMKNITWHADGRIVVGTETMRAKHSSLVTNKQEKYVAATIIPFEQHDGIRDEGLWMMLQRMGGLNGKNYSPEDIRFLVDQVNFKAGQLLVAEREKAMALR